MQSMVLKSPEKGIITKEYIVMHAHLNFQASHFSTLVMKQLKSCAKLQLLL